MSEFHKLIELGPRVLCNLFHKLNLCEVMSILKNVWWKELEQSSKRESNPNISSQLRPNLRFGKVLFHWLWYFKFLCSLPICGFLLPFPWRSGWENMRLQISFLKTTCVVWWGSPYLCRGIAAGWATGGRQISSFSFYTFLSAHDWKLRCGR